MYLAVHVLQLNQGGGGLLVGLGAGTNQKGCIRLVEMDITDSERIAIYTGHAQRVSKLRNPSQVSEGPPTQIAGLISLRVFHLPAQNTGLS